ncbi:MAG: L,D-transpeptidase family protein [Actinomycetes bacterium]
MRGSRRLLAAIATTAVLAVLAAAPALADDVPPAPSSSDAPATPPTVPTTEPAAMDPSASATTAPAPQAPAAKPTSSPFNSKLPLKRGARGERVLEAQMRLQWLGYPISPIDTNSTRVWASTTSAVKKFQVKQFLKPTGDIDTKTWDRLMKVSGTVGYLPDACMHERTLCVDKTQRLIRFVDGGAVQLTLDARFGMSGTSTREGSFRVHRKSRDHTSTLYHTWMPFAMFFSGGQAVHYSPYFARDGYYGGSHGCIGVRDITRAQWLFDRIPVGTKVYVYWS